MSTTTATTTPTHLVEMSFEPGEGPMSDSQWDTALKFQIDEASAQAVGDKPIVFRCYGTNIKNNGFRGQRTSRYVDMPNDLKASLTDQIRILRQAYIR